MTTKTNREVFVETAEVMVREQFESNRKFQAQLRRMTPYILELFDHIPQSKKRADHKDEVSRMKARLLGEIFAAYELSASGLLALARKNGYVGDTFGADAMELLNKHFGMTDRGFYQAVVSRIEFGASGQHLENSKAGAVAGMVYIAKAVSKLLAEYGWRERASTKSEDEAAQDGGDSEDAISNETSEQPGPSPLDQVIAWVQEGKLSPTDLIEVGFIKAAESNVDWLADVFSPAFIKSSGLNV